MNPTIEQQEERINELQHELNQALDDYRHFKDQYLEAKGEILKLSDEVNELRAQNNKLSNSQLCRDNDVNRLLEQRNIAQNMLNKANRALRDRKQSQFRNDVCRIVAAEVSRAGTIATSDKVTLVKDAISVALEIEQQLTELGRL